MSNHSLILTEGRWKISGVYFDSNEKLSSVTGEFVITHHHDKWEGKYTVVIGEKDSRKIELVYSFIPPDDAKKGVAFDSVHSNLGNMTGRVMPSDEHLISVFESVDKKYSGSEYMKMISENYYKNKGLLFKETEKYSSWSFDLRKEKIA